MIPDGVACNNLTCLHHLTKRCEVCGRVAGHTAPPLTAQRSRELVVRVQELAREYGVTIQVVNQYKPPVVTQPTYDPVNLGDFAIGDLVSSRIKMSRLRLHGEVTAILKGGMLRVRLISDLRYTSFHTGSIVTFNPRRVYHHSRPNNGRLFLHIPPSTP